MTVLTPIWLQAGSYSAELDRQVISTFAMPSPANSFAGRSGVVSSIGGSLSVNQTSTASMQLTVNPGVALIAGTYTQGQGTYIVTNDAIVNVTVGASNGTNPRIDSIILEVLDSVYSGTSDLAQFRVVPGTPATSPVAPNVPQNCIVLANVTVPAGSSSISTGNIADMRTFTGPRGEVIPCLSTRRPTSPQVGMEVFETDTFYYRRWDGQYWIYSGTTSDPDNSNATANHTPVVTASASNPAWGNNVTDFLSGWVWGRPDPKICTYNDSTRHFTIVERGLYSLTFELNSDSAYTGRMDSRLALPGGTQSTWTGDIVDIRHRQTGYPGSGFMTSTISTTFYAEAGWDFWFQLFQYNTGGVTVGLIGYMTLTRLPG